MTTHKCFAPVDDDELAMVAVVQHADVAESLFVEKHDSAAGFFHLSRSCFAYFFGALCVKQDTHLHACPSPLRERRRHALTEHPFLPKKGFEMHRLLSGSNSLQKHVEKSAVLQNFDGIAGDGCAERQAGERRNQFIDGRTTFNP